MVVSAIEKGNFERDVQGLSSKLRKSPGSYSADKVTMKNQTIPEQ